MSFGELWLRPQFLKRFADLGVDARRVDLVPLLPTTVEHLNSYGMVDIRFAVCLV